MHRKRRNGALRAQGLTLFRQHIDGVFTPADRSDAIRASQGALNITFSALFDGDYRDIWLNIRLPCVLLAVLVGAALTTAGAIMQGLFRNPMADLRLLGVNSGSALMVGVGIVLPFSLPVVLVLYEQMIFAVAGSMVICTLTY